MRSRDESPRPRPGGIDLGRYGQLWLRSSEGEIVHVSTTGERRSLGPHPLLHEPGEPVWQLSECGESLLLGFARGDRLLWLELAALRLETIPMVERLPRVEQLEIVASGDLVLALCENGIVAIESRGRERWRLCQVTLGWRFVARADGGLCFTDAAGDLRSLDAESGEESSF